MRREVGSLALGGRVNTNIPEPRAPDPNNYGLIAVGVALGAFVITRRDGDWVGLLAAMLVAGGVFFLYLRAHQKYKAALESWALLKRAQPEVMPDPGNVYHISGLVSMKTKEGGWMDIGHGTGTFRILPPHPTMERVGGHVFGIDNRREKQTPLTPRD